MALFIVVLDNGATREWQIPDACAKARLADVMDALAGEPRAGEVGQPQRRINVEPMPEDVPVPETVPATQPDEQPVPA